jgi:hypothetical protein
VRLQKTKITALKLLGKAFELKMAAIKNSDKRAKSIKNKNFRNLALRLREKGRTNKNKKKDKNNTGLKNLKLKLIAINFQNSSEKRLLLFTTPLRGRDGNNSKTVGKCKQ